MIECKISRSLIEFNDSVMAEKGGKSTTFWAPHGPKFLHINST